MLKNRESIAKIFLIIFTFSLFFSYTCEIFCINHECASESCQICYVIELARCMFDNLLIILLICSFITKSEDYIFHEKSLFYDKWRLTPVKLKVRLLE